MTSMVEKGAKALEERLKGEEFFSYEEAARTTIEALKEPTEGMLDAARHLMMWLDFDRPTEAALIAHCKRLGKEPPPECRDVDHVPPKALRTFWIYRAMITAALSEESTS